MAIFRCVERKGLRTGDLTGDAAEPWWATDCWPQWLRRIGERGKPVVACGSNRRVWV